MVETIKNLVQMNGLKSNKVPLYEEHVQKSELKNFSNLRVQPTRGVLLSKIITCEKKDIDIEVDVSKIINFISSNEDFIAKCLSVLIDTAIDLVEGLSKPAVKVEILSAEKNTTFVIVNNYSGNLADIKEKFTGGNGERIEVSKVIKMMSYEHNIKYDLYYDDEKVKQTMHIKNFHN